MSGAMTEEWRATKDPNYEVSSLGRVRSLDRVVMRSNGIPQRLPGRVLSGRDSQGYRMVAMTGGKSEYIHTLVLEAFVGPRPERMEACHGNAIRTDNRLENLRWGTRADNQQDTLRHGHNDRRNRTHCPRGHLLAEPNLVACFVRQGYRSCLSCSRGRAYAKHHGETFSKAHGDRYYSQLIERAA